MNNPDSILSLIEAADPDRLRAAKLAEPEGRESLMWIYGFHLELAKVPEVVSEAMIGDIRYQWWRDAAAEIYAGGAVRAHEVTTPLADVLRRCDIPRFWVDRLIDGRNRDLDPTPFADIDAARDYCRETSGVLMQIAAKSLCEDFDGGFVQNAGEAWGLLGLARAYGYYHDSMLSALAFGEILDAVQNAYDNIKGKSLDARLMPACAYAGLIPLFMKKMRAGSFDPKSELVALSPFAKQLRQFQTTLKGRF